MDNPFVREQQMLSELPSWKEFIDHFAMFSPALMQLRAQQMRIDEMKHLSAIEIRNRFHSVLPGRKPLWAKIEEETAMCYEMLRRRCEHSTRSVTTIEVADIIEQYRRSHPDTESEWHVEPAIRRNIFREYYYRAVKQYPVLEDNAFVHMTAKDGQQVCMSGGLYKAIKSKL